MKKRTNPGEHAQKRLMKAIRRFANAQVGISWSGSAEPADMPGIEQEFDAAYQNLLETMRTMHISEGGLYWNICEDRPRTAVERKAYMRELEAAIRIA